MQVSHLVMTRYSTPLTSEGSVRDVKGTRHHDRLHRRKEGSDVFSMFYYNLGGLGVEFRPFRFCMDLGLDDTLEQVCVSWSY